MLLLVFLGLLSTLCTGALCFVSFLERDAVSVSAVRLQQLTRAPVMADRATIRFASVRGGISLLAGWVRSRAGGRKGSIQKGEALRQRFACAGYTGTFAMDVYLAARVLLPVLALAGAAFSPMWRPMLMGTLPVVLFVAPSLLLTAIMRRRRARIRRSMPDVLDLLVICVDAGLGLDAAVARVADELQLSHPEIGDEFVKVGREQRAGKPRMQAWQDMAACVAVPEMENFVAMILQAERFGTPIARALSTFAGVSRQQRTQKAEENAKKATVKIVFPLVLFIFPCIFIVLLGPAALTLIRSFAGELK